MHGRVLPILGGPENFGKFLTTQMHLLAQAGSFDVLLLQIGSALWAVHRFMTPPPTHPQKKMPNWFWGLGYTFQHHRVFCLYQKIQALMLKTFIISFMTNPCIVTKFQTDRKGILTQKIIQIQNHHHTAVIMQQDCRMPLKHRLNHMFILVQPTMTANGIPQLRLAHKSR